MQRKTRISSGGFVVETGPITSCRKISTWLFAFVFLTGMCQCVLGENMEASAVKGITSVGHLDIEGGGMVDVRGPLAVIGHMEPPFANKYPRRIRPWASAGPFQNQDAARRPLTQGAPLREYPGH